MNSPQKHPAGSPLKTPPLAIKATKKEKKGVGSFSEKKVDKREKKREQGKKKKKKKKGDSFSTFFFLFCSFFHS